MQILNIGGLWIDYAKCHKDTNNTEDILKYHIAPIDSNVN